MSRVDAFEAELGDAQDPDNPLGYWSMLEIDSAGELPHIACRRLAKLGFGQDMVPVEGGGRMLELESLHHLTRCLTRRNPTLMPGVMYGIGPTLLVAMAGNKVQQREIFAATNVCRPVALALASPTAGSDLLQGQLEARKTDRGWRLYGEKWPVGRNCDAARVITLAKTGAAGPAAFSLFLVGNPACGGEPQRLTTGMRGVDVGSITFDGTPASNRNLIGQLGHGFELTLKLQCLIKLMSSAADLGALDTALRLALDMARAGDRPMIRHEHVRCLLIELYLDLLALDALVGLGLRAVSLEPGQVSILSSVIKDAATRTSRVATERLWTMFGTGLAMAASPQHRLLLKLLSDLSVVRVMDTNEIANLRNVGTQLESVGRRLESVNAVDALKRCSRLAQLGAWLPAAQFESVTMVNSGGDLVISALSALPGDDPLHLQIVEWRDRFFECLASARQELGRDFSNSAWLLEAAKDYTRLTQAAASALVRQQLGETEVLGLAIKRLLDRRQVFRPETNSARQKAFQRLIDAHDSGSTFSVCPTKVGGHHPSFDKRACA